MGDGVAKDPRDENYWDMWKTTFCPDFTMCSFTFLMLVVQLIFFIITLIHTVNYTEKGLNSTFFLGIQPYSLQVFGMRMPYYMKKGQIWRFITPLVLNYGATTMFLNLVLTTVIGFILEANLGSLRMLVFYLIAGMGGTLFGTVGSPKYAAGPEPALIGMCAALIGWFMFYWESFENRCDFGQRICMFLLLTILVIFLVYIMIM